MRLTTIGLVLLLIVGAALAQRPIEVDDISLAPRDATALSAPPRAELVENTLIIYVGHYADMDYANGYLIVRGSAQVDSASLNVAQSRAMAERTAQYSARAALVEFFTALGFNSADSATNADKAQHVETLYFDDGTLEYVTRLNIAESGGLAPALGVEVDLR